MSNIVIELQKECLDESCKISSLIRKAYVIAKKLNITDFLDWSQKELNGYSKDINTINDCPEYREVNVEYRAFNLYKGWIPVIIPSNSDFAVLLKQQVSESIEQIENLLAKADGNISFRVNSDIQQMMNSNGSANFEINGFIGKVQFVGILNSVRNIILDWTLKLEENNIIGSGITFTSEEKEKAATGIVNYGTIVYGSVHSSQVVGSGQKISQEQTISEIESKELLKLINMIETNYSSIDLPENKLKKLNSSIEEIKIELNTTKRKSKIYAILGTIKSVFEGIVGSLIASGIIFEISKYIQ